MMTEIDIKKVNRKKNKIKFIDSGIKYLQDIEIKGSFIVIEGPDASGRSTRLTK